MIGLITVSSSRTALSGSSSVSMQLRHYNTPSHGSSGKAACWRMRGNKENNCNGLFTPQVEWRQNVTKSE